MKVPTVDGYWLRLHKDDENVRPYQIIAADIFANHVFENQTEIPDVEWVLGCIDGNVNVKFERWEKNSTGMGMTMETLEQYYGCPMEPNKDIKYSKKKQHKTKIRNKIKQKINMQ